MTITLSFEIESPRGPVNISADLSGLPSWQMNKEIESFFSAITTLKCQIYDMQKREEEATKAYSSIPVTPVYTEAITCDPIEVAS